MSVTPQVPIASSIANGITTSFPHSFKLLAADDLVVAGYMLGVHYTVTGVGADTGSVEFFAPPAAGTTILRYRSSLLRRVTDYQNNGDLLAATVNPDFDRTWLALQDLVAGNIPINRTLHLGPGSDWSGLLAPEPLKLLGWDGLGKSIVNYSMTVLGGIFDALQVFFTNIGIGAISRTVGDKFRRWGAVDVEDYGAVGDEITDDLAAFQKALATGKDVNAPGRYYCSDTVLSNFVGQRIHGAGGGNAARITSGSLTGPAVQFLQRQSGLRAITISANAARAALPWSINTPGVMFGGAGAGSLTSSYGEDVVVQFQPGQSLQMHREAASSRFVNWTSQYNKGHGFFADDGTSVGLSPQRGGIVTFVNFRSNGDGGNAVCIAPAGFTGYRYVFENLEVFDNAWNTAEIPGLINAEVYARAQNSTFSNGATADQNFAATTMGPGGIYTRAAKASAARGIEVASFSTNITWQNMRQINTSQTMRTGSSVAGVKVSQTYANAVQASGFSIGSGNSGLDFEITDPAMYTSLMTSATNGGRLVVDGSVRDIRVGNNVHFKRFEAATIPIVSDSLNAYAGTVDLVGEGDVADVISQLTYSGGGNPLQDGDLVVALNRKAYGITLKHATGNIFLASGADTVVGSNKAKLFVAFGGNAYQIGV